ncbi:hypothetical protein [[Eubacterium] cellulosolvens]
MQRQPLLAVSLLIILVLSCSAATVRGSSLNYLVHDGKVSVDLSLDFFQNATAMPTLETELTGLSAQDLASALEESVKKRIGDASVSSLSAELASEESWINSTIRFEVTGVSSRKGDLLSVNCSWIALDVSRDLRVENLSYNLIGATYVKPAFEKYLDYDKLPLNETIERVTYLSRQDELSPRYGALRAGNATLLDFRNLAQPIQEWERTYDVTEGSTTWAYSPGPAVDLTMTVTPREGTPFTAHAFYNYSAAVSVDGLAQANGNILVTDVSSGFEPLVMLAIIIAAFVIAVLASWSYRVRRRQIPRRRK